ncbi:MAG: phage regulatory CII family protein [Pseudomonadota bacterium]
MNVADAFYRTVHAAVGGCESLASRLGMSVAVLRNKANPNNAGNKVTLDEADRIMGLTEDYSVLHSLALNHGYVCVKVEAAATSSDMAVLELVTKVMGTNGEVGSLVYQTLADGRVEKWEVDKVREAVYRAQRALQETVTRLDGMAEK